MVKFSFLYSLRSRGALKRNSGCLSAVKGRLEPYLKQKRKYTDKAGKPSEPAKEEQSTVKMPGFVHPEHIKEEGYFTQKAKKELEELKRKPETVESPAKKI